MKNIKLFLLSIQLDHYQWRVKKGKEAAVKVKELKSKLVGLTNKVRAE
jgi:hypothetical protein